MAPSRAASIGPAPQRSAPPPGLRARCGRGRARPAPSSRLPIASVRPGSRLRVTFILPSHHIPHPELAVREHLRERSPAPLRVHRLAQPRKHLIHPLARLRLTRDTQPNLPHLEHASTRPRQGDAPEHQVRPPGGGRSVTAETAHQPLPHLLFDERHLSAPPLIRASHESTPGHHPRRSRRIHRPPVRPLDPDRAEQPLAGGADGTGRFGFPPGGRGDQGAATVVTAKTFESTVPAGRPQTPGTRQPSMK